jgi:hypothetical protein
MTSFERSALDYAFLDPIFRYRPAMAGVNAKPVARQHTGAPRQAASLRLNSNRFFREPIGDILHLLFQPLVNPPNTTRMLKGDISEFQEPIPFCR